MSILQQFNSHSDENDPERIENIVKKAVEDSKWIMKKNCEKKKIGVLTRDVPGAGADAMVSGTGRCHWFWPRQLL
uniref:Uncharacterized protein n=1 Tax=Romanomermis culicivorax TaxID=13658 RepID=A0A915ICU9_ROMCU